MARGVVGRSVGRKLLIVIVIGSLVSAAAGCTEPSAIRLSGRVDDNIAVIQAPMLPVRQPDLGAGFAVSRTANGAGAGDRTNRLSAAAITGLGGWNGVARVEVAAGDRVTVGQVVARFDDAVVRAGLAVARADAEVASREVPVLNSAIADTVDKEHDIDDALSKIDDAIEELTATRGTLAAQLRQATGQLPVLLAKLNDVDAQRRSAGSHLAQIEQQLAPLRTQLAQLPAPQPGEPPLPARTQLLAGIEQLAQAGTQLRAALVKLDNAYGQLSVGLGRLRTGIPKLRSAIAMIDRGLATARGQRAKLRRAKDTIIDVRGQLRRTRKLALVAADAARVEVGVAENGILLTTVTAPASGVVVDVVPAGELLAAGATVATIRPDGDATVTVWAAPSQLAHLCLGTKASVSGDWMAGGRPVPAAITRIAERADYPPTTFATDEIHLTRAVPITLTVTAEPGMARVSLPAGAPVDVTMSTTLGDRPCSRPTTDR